MNTTQKIARNSMIIIFGDVINKIITLAVGIFLIRYLSAISYGKLSFALAYLLFFNVLTDLGINQILVREISRDKSIAAKYIGNAGIVKLVLSILATTLAITIITLMHYPQDTTFYIYIMSLTILFTAFSDLFSLIFQVELKMEYRMLVNLIDRVLSAGLMFWLIFTYGTLLQIIIVLVFSKLVALFVSYFFSRKFVRHKFEFNINIFKFLLKESWPLALTAFFVMIYLRIDQVMLSWMKGDAAVGYYTAPVRLAESLSIIPFAFTISIFPLLSKYYNTSRISHKRTYQVSFKYMLMIIIPIAVGTTLLAKPIIQLFFGTKFLPSIPVLQILIWSEVFVFFGFIYNKILISANKQIFDLVFTSIAAITNIILNFIFIPRIGIVGAAIATVISYSIGSGAVPGLFLLATREYNLSGLQHMIKPVIASSIMGIYVYYMKFNLPLAIIGGVIIFFLVMFLIRGINIQDIKLIKATFILRKGDIVNKK